MLIGDQRRTCTNSGRWDLPVYGYTECLREYRIIGIKGRMCWMLLRWKKDTEEILNKFTDCGSNGTGSVLWDDGGILVTSERMRE